MFATDTKQYIFGPFWWNIHVRQVWSNRNYVFWKEVSQDVRTIDASDWLIADLGAVKGPYFMSTY